MLPGFFMIRSGCPKSMVLQHKAMKNGMKLLLKISCLE